MRSLRCKKSYTSIAVLVVVILCHWPDRQLVACYCHVQITASLSPGLVITGTWLHRAARASPPFVSIEAYHSVTECCSIHLVIAAQCLLHLPFVKLASSDADQTTLKKLAKAVALIPDASLCHGSAFTLSTFCTSQDAEPFLALSDGRQVSIWGVHLLPQLRYHIRPVLPRPIENLFVSLAIYYRL